MDIYGRPSPSKSSTKYTYKCRKETVNDAHAVTHALFHDCSSSERLPLDRSTRSSTKQPASFTDVLHELGRRELRSESLCMTCTPHRRTGWSSVGYCSYREGKAAVVNSLVYNDYR